MKKYLQSGQTLIETLVASFILIMGISSAVTLAIYTLGISTNVTKQIVAAGLAREGVEIVRNMRDTNWLKQTVINTDCYNFKTGASTARCYRNWTTQVFNLGATTQGKVKIDPAIANFLKINTCNIRYGLNFDSNINGASFQGYYRYPEVGVACNVSNPGVPVISAIVDPAKTVFARKIIIEHYTAAPYNSTGYPRIKVTSQVWWNDKKCPKNNVWPGLGKCSVQIVSYLTNWKDY